MSWLVAEVLGERGFRVLDMLRVEDVDRADVAIARDLHRKYRVSRPLMRKLKNVTARLYRGGRGFRLPLSRFDRATRRGIVGTGMMLHKAGWLEAFRVTPPPAHAVTGRLRKDPRIVNMINGRWLELAILDVLEMLVLQSKAERTDIGYSVRVMAPYKREHELDLVAVIDDLLVWVELKTSHKIGKCIGRYRKIAAHLSIPPDHAVLVCSEPQQRTNVGTIAVRWRGLTLCDAWSFRKHVQRVLMERDTILSAARETAAGV